MRLTWCFWALLLALWSTACTAQAVEEAFEEVDVPTPADDAEEQPLEEPIADEEPEAAAAPEVVAAVPDAAAATPPPKRPGFLKRYDKLLKDHYLAASFVQATALGITGDVLAQLVERATGSVHVPLPVGKHVAGPVRARRPFGINWRRTMDVGLLTMFIDGVITPHWYNLMEKISTAKTLPVALLKTFLGTIIYGPLANGLFLAGVPALRVGMRGLLKGAFDGAAWRRQLFVAMIRDIQMWPPFNLLNFWLLDKHWRPLAANVVGVGFVAVLSATGISDETVPFGAAAAALIASRVKAVLEMILRAWGVASSAVGAAVQALDARLIALWLSTRDKVSDVSDRLRKRRTGAQALTPLDSGAAIPAAAPAA